MIIPDAHKDFFISLILKSFHKAAGWVNTDTVLEQGKQDCCRRVLL